MKVQAQSKSALPKIIPLTPNATEFVRYGDYQVNTLTGRPEISIPIYNVVSGSLKLPISISYFAGGIKVSQVATWIGLGWSLNAGGIISRSVRGIPDEVPQYGWIDDVISPSELTSTQDASLIQKYGDRLRDAEPDFFSYNLPTASGKFIYKRNIQKFEAIPYSPVKITRTVGATDINNNYQITDENGIDYIFAQKQNYSNDNDLEISQTLRFYTQSWYLTKIISANKKDSILFKYEYKPVSTDLGNGRSTQPEWIIYPSYSKTFYKSGNSEAGNYGVFTDQGITQSSSSISTAEPNLTEIIFKNGKIIFNAITGRKDYPGAMLNNLSVYAMNSTGGYDLIEKQVFDYDYFTTNNPVGQWDYRLKLNSISKMSSTGNVIDRHNFEYETTKLPSTMSTAQDYWGYYNGREQEFLPNVPPTNPELQQWYSKTPLGSADRSSDISYMQAGILKKITYPTGGYTAFDFEANKYKSDIVTYVNVSVVDTRLNGAGKRNPVSTSQDFYWPTDAIDTLGIFNITFSAHTNPSAADVAQRVTLRDLTTGQDVNSWEHTGNFEVPLTISPGYRFNRSHQYRVTIRIDDDAATKISLALYCEKINTSNQIKDGGGLRVRKIENHDSNNSIQSIIAYSYKGSNGEGVGNFLRTDVDFVKNSYKRYDWAYNPNCDPTKPWSECLLYKDERIIFVGQGDIPQVDFAGSSVTYDEVTKFYLNANGESNGKIVYSSNTKIFPSSIENLNVPGGRWYFENNMVQDGKLPSEHYYSYDKNANSYKLTKERIYQYDTLVNSDTQGATSISRIVYFPLATGSLENYLSTTDFSRAYYPIHMGAYRLSRLIERNYEQSGISELITENSYNNLGLQSRSTSNKSNGKSIVNINLYATDFNSGIPFIDDMINNNNISTPIESVSYMQSPEKTVVRGSLIQFRGGGGLIDRVFQFESNEQLAVSNFKFSNQTIGVLPEINTLGTYSPDLHYQEKVTYDKYNDNGNLLSVKQKDGMSVNYLWSYNFAYPIAEIRNIDYSTVESILGGPTAVSNFADSNPTDQQVKDLVSILRNSPLLKNAQITSYTYKPLVGMSSQTDAKGMTTYYDYDEFGRLKTVKDQNSNILKQTEYHYKN